MVVAIAAFVVGWLTSLAALAAARRPSLAYVVCAGSLAAAALNAVAVAETRGSPFVQAACLTCVFLWSFNAYRAATLVR